MKVDRVARPESVAKILEALDHRLSFVDNFDASAMEVDDTGPADTEFTVYHTLGRVPRTFLYSADSPTTVYASRRSEWTSGQIYLKSTAASSTLILTIL